MSVGHELPKSALDVARLFDGWVSRRSPMANSLWAKSGDESGYLSLTQHLVDVACAAAAVFDVWLAANVKRQLAKELGIEVEEVRTLYLWLAGVHDCGKATMTFQSQIEMTYPHIVNAVYDSGLTLEKPNLELKLPKMPHGISSGVLVSKWLQGQGLSALLARRIASTVDAHHGIASADSEARTIRLILDGYPETWKAVQDEIITAMADTLDVYPVLEKLGEVRLAQGGVAQILTGIIVIADWIASNADAFPMVVQQSQEERLKDAMALTDLTNPWTTSVPNKDMDTFYRDSFGWPDSFNAKSVQQAIVECARQLKGPALVMLEAETGVGKTEAALAAAHIIGRNTSAQGIYFAAPTMSTANGILERTIEWAKNTGARETVASMYLAHSKNQLSTQFKKLKLQNIAEDVPEHGGAVVASQWMNGKRRGLLSNIVVGTVDQVLMLALEQRYSMLRHAALAGKIIIFDEVHAYDAYTSDYLETTLEWLAYYGATVIMMSATLPANRRAALAQAYTGHRLENVPDSYPLITVGTADGYSFATPAPNPTNLRASVQVIGDSLDELENLTHELLIDGGCALIICNTIARAQDVYRTLSSAYPEKVELHHAGFMAWERSQKEDFLREQLGPKASRGDGRPDFKIVVATQVAEQSLDIDADVLITDLAPMDLIIQRAGRLHRHNRSEHDRPEPVRKPKIFIRGLTQVAPTPEIDGGAMAIYDPKILVATLLHLPKEFNRPDDIVGLVQATYSDDQPEMGEELQELWEQAKITSAQREAEAHRRSKGFRTPSPFTVKELNQLFSKVNAALSLADEEAGAAQVRDAEPTVEVIPIIQTEYGYRPLGKEMEILDENDVDYPTAFHLASSTLRLPARMTRYASDFEQVISELERNTPVSWSKHFLLKGQVALVLDEDKTARVGRFVVTYSSELGFEILSDGKKADVHA
ncbi:CRISPR-associated protein [Corynebacterium renale]|uniref:CRISPR-associated helicase Cas3' n=2 Tax=Corynebacterium renale TaxID=1724 RepID=UPI000DA3B653|nr:CRISPR-associated helicase Cas3' [Corynebacterium renale]SQG63716.1 CRISPR-associated protein [Corynebacterium renale]